MESQQSRMDTQQTRMDSQQSRMEPMRADFPINRRVRPTDLVANVVFVIENTGVVGGYLADLQKDYIVPTLEYFSQGVTPEFQSCPIAFSKFLYGIVLFRTAQCLPDKTCTTYGPFASPQKVLSCIDNLE